MRPSGRCDRTHSSSPSPPPPALRSAFTSNVMEKAEQPNLILRKPKLLFVSYIHI